MAVGQRRSKIDGETSDSPERRAQRMHGEALAFGLSAEYDALRGEKSWLRGDRNAKTLVKEPGFRVVLVAMRAGAHLAEHAVHEQATVQVLTGHLTIHVGSRHLDVRSDGLVALEPHVEHDVEALEESAVLLTIAAGPGPAQSRAARQPRRQRTSSRSSQRWADDGGRTPMGEDAVGDLSAT